MTIDIDTGFNFKCSCCCQFKGLEICRKVTEISKDEQEEYLFLNEITKSKDGYFYVCYQCKNSIKRGQMKSKTERAYKLPDPFPKSLERNLQRECHLQEILLAYIRRFGT